MSPTIWGFAQTLCHHNYNTKHHHNTKDNTNDETRGQTPPNGGFPAPRVAKERLVSQEPQDNRQERPSRIVRDYVGAYKIRAASVTSRILPFAPWHSKQSFQLFKFLCSRLQPLVRTISRKLSRLVPANKNSHTFAMEAANYEAKEALEGVSGCFFVHPPSKHSDTDGAE